MKARNRADTGHMISAWYRLIAKVYKVALRDAKQGKRDAIEFLDCTCPDWRVRLKNTEIAEEC